VTARAVQELRAAWWAARALRSARAQLRADALAVPALPAVPTGRAGTDTVDRVLDLARGSCLEKAAVRQVWLAARGRRHDLVIGVTAPTGFAAHAWLDGAGEEPPPGYTEIVRRGAR
jgi:Transglutaminase-like superfamily